MRVINFTNIINIYQQILEIHNTKHKTRIEKWLNRIQNYVVEFVLTGSELSVEYLICILCS